jgi:TetR/AcrR family transcriptional regulator, upper aerobic nicotinate degradation pathway regulator
MKRTTKNLRMAAGRSGIRERRAERTRDEILRAGLKVFADKGFRAATMEDIAIELDATKGLLYYHFKTKDEILQEVLASNSLVHGVEGIFAALPAMPARQALGVAAAGALKLMGTHRELVRFLHVSALLRGPEAEVVYTEVLDRLYAGVAQVMEHFKSSGEIRSDVSAEYLARLLVDLVISHFIHGEMFGEHRLPGPDFLDESIGILLDGISIKNPENNSPPIGEMKR